MGAAVDNMRITTSDPTISADPGYPKAEAELNGRVSLFAKAYVKATIDAVSMFGIEAGGTIQTGATFDTTVNPQLSCTGIDATVKAGLCLGCGLDAYVKADLNACERSLLPTIPSISLGFEKSYNFPIPCPTPTITPCLDMEYVNGEFQCLSQNGHIDPLTPWLNNAISDTANDASG